MANSSIFVFADNSTAAYNYYEAGSSLNPYTVQSNKNSADMLGYLLRVLSLNQSRIYDRLSNLSGGGADLTTVNSYITAIDSKLGVIRDSLGIGSSLENVLSNQSSNLQHINTIINKLSYWDNNHARSYDISEMIFNIMGFSSDLVVNTSSVPAIKQDTSHIPSIDTNTSNILSRIDNFTKTTFRFLSKNGTYDAELTFNDIGNNNVPYYSYNNGSPRVLYTGASNIGLQGYLDVLNKNLVSVGNLIHENYAYYSVYNKDANGNYNAISRYNYSLMDVLQNINVQFGSMLAPIQYMIADADSIAAKRANASQEQAVLSNYTGNGSASASAADFGNIKDSVGSVKSGLNTNVSVSNIFNIFNNNDGYGFWSDDTRNELNSTGSNRNNLKARRVSDTPLYDAKISELYNAMGVNYE